MGDVVNLNRFRKQRRRDEREKQASENRIRFGTPKSETSRQRLEQDRQARDLDGKKRED